MVLMMMQIEYLIDVTVCVLNELLLDSLLLLALCYFSRVPHLLYSYVPVPLVGSCMYVVKAP